MTADPVPLLIGQYDSPFVRRVAIAMRLYGVTYEHRNWSVFRDAERIAAYNPLRRVPTLVLPGGEVLVESSAIVDYLDDQAPDRDVLLPRRGPERRVGLRLCAVSFGLADKGVALVYEKVAREVGTQSQRWTERCAAQVADTLLLLERERAAVSAPWMLGDRMTHSDIALGIVVHFLKQAAPALLAALALPALLDHEARCHALPVFQEIDAPLHFPE